MKEKLLVVVLLVVVLLVLVGKSTSAQWTALGGGFDRQGRVLYFDSVSVSLYAGGIFSIADSIPVNGIARWDGAQWYNLGNGALYSGITYYIGKYQSNILASGLFVDPSIDGEKWLNIWNGISWDTLNPNLNSYIQTMVEDDGQYYFGGIFDASGSTPLNLIARFDGLSFYNYPLPSNSFSVNAICFYHDSMFIGGNFYDTISMTNDFEVWNGTAFQPVGSISQQLNGIVNDMVEYNGELYIGGSFNSIQGDNLIKWNGNSFSNVGLGVNGQVFKLKVHNGELYACGQFDLAGGIQVSKMAKWNGVSWSEVFPYETGNNGIGDFLFYGNEMYVTGSFQNLGGIVVNNIAKYTLPISIEEYRERKLLIYPVPSLNQIIVELSKSNIENIYIKDVSGKLSKSISCFTSKIEIDISSLTSGIYFIEATSEQGIFRKKFVKN